MVNASEKELNRKQQVTLDHWFTPKTDKEIAEIAGVSQKQLIFWKKQPHFQAALAEREQSVKEHAASILADASTDAAYGLATLAKRLDRQACVDVLKASRVYVEKVENDVRVREACGPIFQQVIQIIKEECGEEPASRVGTRLDEIGRIGK